MKDYFSIGEAAEMVDMTPETLRHYDRIHLVKPSFKDQWTGYRYYSPQEIIRLHTVRALRYMDMSLAEIKKILELDRLEDVVYSLKQAEKTADEKMARLRFAKEKIRLARRDYEKKTWDSPRDGGCLYATSSSTDDSAFRHHADSDPGQPLELSQPFLCAVGGFLQRSISIRGFGRDVHPQGNHPPFRNLPAVSL